MRINALTDADIKVYVANGTKVLDEHDPEWFNQIDLARLDQDSCFDCILGQLFMTKERDDPRLRAPYFCALNKWHIASSSCYTPGFIPFTFESIQNEDQEAYLKQLNDEWKRVILERRQQQEQS